MGKRGLPLLLVTASVLSGRTAAAEVSVEIGPAALEATTYAVSGAQLGFGFLHLLVGYEPSRDLRLTFFTKAHISTITAQADGDAFVFLSAGVRHRTDLGPDDKKPYFMVGGALGVPYFFFGKVDGVSVHGHFELGLETMLDESTALSMGLRAEPIIIVGSGLDIFGALQTVFAIRFGR